MSTCAVGGIASSYLQSILSTALQTSGLNKSSSSLSGVDASTITPQSDRGKLSPFAQVLSELQQLQQTDPSKYQQVTQQIATNLQSAAQTAQTNGNTSAANQLTHLSTDFTNASTSGQLPNIQDLASAISTGHHHHHHAQSSSGDSSSSSSNSSNSSNAVSNSVNQMLSQLLAAYQSNSTQSSNSLDPMSIIMSTLSNAGITASNG